MIKEAQSMMEKMRRQSCMVQRELANEELRKAQTRGSIASESDQLKHGCIILEGQRPAEFISNLSQHSCMMFPVEDLE